MNDASHLSVLVLNIVLVVLLLLNLIMSVYRWAKSGTTLAPPAQTVTIKIVQQDDIKFATETNLETSADAVRMLTRSLEAITLDKSKNVLLEISNRENGGFKARSKFGSS